MLRLLIPRVGDRGKTEGGKKKVNPFMSSLLGGKLNDVATQPFRDRGQGERTDLANKGRYLTQVKKKGRSHLYAPKLEGDTKAKHIGTVEK